MGERGAEHFLLPVGVVDFAVESELCGCRLAETGANDVGKFLTAHHVEFLAGGVDGEVGCEADLGASAHAFLCGYDDDTVGSAATVDGGCGSVLEDSHRFDVLGVDHCEGAHSAALGLVGLGHTVDHDKRVV